MFDRILLIWLYLFEGGALLGIAAYHRLGDRPILGSLGTRPGLALSIAACIFMIATVALILKFLRSRKEFFQTFAATLLLNGFGILLCFVGVELGIRVFSIQTHAGPMFRDFLLPPRDWKAAAAYMKTLVPKYTEKAAFLVYDPDIGWVTGTNRVSQDGISFSSMEGIRSSKSGESMLREKSLYRIALVGDSFTFSSEVNYEQSWGHQLEKLLGSEYQVRNWGCPGYGIDQAYFRYLRDVRPWRPQIVIFGVFQDDLIRSLSVYPFLRSPTLEVPFSKPRFILGSNGLKLLNAPTIAIEDFTSKPRISDLPAVNYDPSYHPSDWDSKIYRCSYFLRYLAVRFPSARPSQERAIEQETKDLNTQILRSFWDAAVKDGSIPVLLLLPSREDFRAGISDSNCYSAQARGILKELSHPFLDLSPCISRIPESQRYADGGHYLPRACAAIAEELRAPILTLVKQNAENRAAFK